MNIISKINDLKYISRYKDEDLNIINHQELDSTFGLSQDYIEYHIYSNDILLKSNYNYIDYKSSPNTKNNDDGTINSIDLSPEISLYDQGFNQGIFDINYNFFRKRYTQNIDNSFFIKDISNSRTEIRISNNYLSNDEIEQYTNEIINEINTLEYYKVFLLNFGKNKCSIILNVALDKSSNQYDILIKLYEPLPTEFKIKNTFWIVEEISNSVLFNINISEYFKKESSKQLRGPNFNLDINYPIQNNTEYNNYLDLFTSTSGSQYQQVLNIVNNKGIKINIDYTDFNNFINFSSIKERIINFKFKLELIQDFESQLLLLNNTSSDQYIEQNKKIINDKIDNIVKKFDGYESFLYYVKNPNSWPKTNNKCDLVTDSTSISWFESQTSIAEIYDLNNKNNLIYTLPEFILIDNQNDPYSLFLNMIGQHFDNLLIYIKSLTDINSNINNTDLGISKDLAELMLKSFGIKLYANNESENIFSYLLEDTNNYNITSSNIKQSEKDTNKEIYKRLYHNLPYLLKTKGTERGVKALISCFGIPSTILNVNEFGGGDKDIDTIDYTKDRYSYCLHLDNSGSLTIPQTISPSSTYPEAVELRFKLDNNYNFATQSLIEWDPKIKIEIISGSNSIKLTYNNSNSIIDNIPSFYGEWFNILLNIKNNIGVDIYIENKNGYSFSSSINDNSNLWYNDKQAIIGGLGNISIQEFRYWKYNLNQENLREHTNNPLSISDINFNSSFDDLIFRLPLGNNLIQDTNTYHPNGLPPFSNPFISASINNCSFISNEEKYNILYPSVGITQKNNYNKIYIDTPISGTLLSNKVVLENEDNKTKNLHYVDVVFNPSEEINKNIINNLGYFNIDNFIGVPSNFELDNYPDLNILKNQYFQEYLNQIDINKYIKLLKSFNNSLFNMIKDFVPAKSNLSTGIKIESHILERNKIKQYYPKIEDIKSLDLVTPKIHISENTDPIFYLLGGNKKSYYNGEISGSILSVPQYYTFLKNKFKGFGINNLNDFIHSDYNVLLNNTYNNILSHQRYTLDEYNTNISSSSELQDYYLSMKYYLNSRYDGSKQISRLKNNFTAGDVSLDKSSCVNVYSNKIALFSEINKNLFLKDKSNIVIKYLVDKDGNLTELNKSNKNWFEVQNTFLSYNDTVISLFDNQKYSNQKSLDGSKGINVSGYSYEPILYYSLNTDSLNFYLSEYKDSSYLEATFFPGNISSSAYPINTSYNNIINNIFDNILENSNNNYTTGSKGGTNLSSLPKYSVSEDSNYNLDIQFQLTPSFNNLTSSNLYTRDASYLEYDFTLYRNPSEGDINSTGSSTVISNSTKKYIDVIGENIITQNYSLGLRDTSSNISNYYLNNNLSPIISPIRVNFSAPRFTSGTNRVEISLTITATEVRLGDAIYIHIRERNPGITTIVTVDENIIKAANDVGGRLTAFANKIIQELNKYNPQLQYVTYPTLINSTSTSVVIFIPLLDNAGSGLDADIKMINLYKNITPTSDIKLNTNILDKNNNIILNKNTQIYNYNLSDINLDTGISESINFWSISSSLKLNDKSNIGDINSRYTSSLLSGDYSYFSNFFMSTSSLGKIYKLPSNIYSFNNFINPDSEVSTYDINVQENLFLETGESLNFTLRETQKYPGNANSYIIPGNPNVTILKVSTNPNNISITQDGKGFLDNLSTTSSLVFSNKLSNIISKDNISYNPNSELYLSDLYKKYGDIDFPFDIEKYDLLILKDRNDIIFEYPILSSYMSGSLYYINLNGSIPQQFLDNIMGLKTEKLYYEFIILKKVKDENNIIINQNKKPGKTSYGLVIPNNVNPEILDNIDTITREIKSKILIDGQNIGLEGIDSGEF